MSSEQEILFAVREMKASVDRLNKTLLEDYPKRNELRRDRIRFAGLIVIALIISIFVSVLVTIGTVSGCFLSRAALDGEASRFCNALPGYSIAQERNQRTLKRFEELYGTIQHNKQVNRRQEARIERLERQLGQ